MLRGIGGTFVVILLLIVSACGTNNEVSQFEEPEIVLEEPKQTEQKPTEPIKQQDEENSQEQVEQPVEEQVKSYDNVQDFIIDNYEYVETINSSTNSGDISSVYRANAKSLIQVSNDIVNQFLPRDLSDIHDGKQVIIYDNPQYFVVLTEDGEGTNIELAEYGFVRDNFSPDFFDGLLLLWVLDEVLDVDDWGKKQRNRCYEGYGDCYHGYGGTGGSVRSKGSVSSKGSTSKPDFRGYSSSVRGGGPGSGK
ncbi:DUF4247 domain-containing protein [Bacillus solimangrovi]|uniref:DUF4247 domain-containing protein n=1 Tax=Bacillus solimangrovi TaxID=1305675 RepID=A0A1E5LCP1_9BACI|nr:DUF4247 domain-containing protein [Bacillus solimangrovi]OEH91843.1 hypothetical protein BFG57_03645 [Bacillus solimangrovi]